MLESTIRRRNGSRVHTGCEHVGSLLQLDGGNGEGVCRETKRSRLNLKRVRGMLQNEFRSLRNKPPFSGIIIINEAPIWWGLSVGIGQAMNGTRNYA